MHANREPIAYALSDALYFTASFELVMKYEHIIS